MIVWTIGHSTRSIEDLIALLRREEIAHLVDIRRFPGSRRYPQFDRDALATRLRASGIDYTHLPELGGRRRPRPDAPATAWRNEGFAGYADYMRTPEFHTALDRLQEMAAARRVAIMCSEAVPWRCHRTLVSDALVARGIEARHILDAKTSPHVVTRFAVVRGTEVTYPPVTQPDEQLEIGSDRV